MAPRLQVNGTIGRISRDLERLIGREDLLIRVTADVGDQMTKAGLFKAAPLDVLFVMVVINYLDKNGELMPTSCNRGKAWRHSKSRREYLAEVNLNVSDVDKKPLAAELAMATLLPRARTLVAQAVALVAMEHGEKASLVESFMAALGVKPAEQQRSASSASDDPQEVIVEVSYKDQGEPLAGAKKTRSGLRQQMEAELGRRKLGVFDGASSGDGTMEIAFKVTEAEIAIQELTRVMLEAGFKPGEFTVREL